MKKYKIYPPIGIGRVGGSDSIFICPETSESFGIEIDADGNENELTEFKDSNGLLKRQASRFTVFELDENSSEYKPIQNNNITIKWEVQLANKKASVVRPSNGYPPRNAPNLPLEMRNNENELSIISDVVTINSDSNEVFDLVGKYKETSVYLGSINTDSKGNLIVAGGKGISQGPYIPNMNFYYSPDWFDDTSDGYIKATIFFEDGSKINAEGSWFIVAPPDFAPSVKSVVTLYDILRNLEVNNGRIVVDRFEFFRDILPMINRFKEHQWVENGDFEINYSVAELRNSSYENFSIRSEVYQKILTIQNLQKFSLTDFQLEALNSYMYGDFITAEDQELPIADKLTKTVLDTTVGQAFYPGIELGILSENDTIYAEPFRFNQSKILPGELTALMALPWQADFLKCSNGWWPSQRPNKIYDKNKIEKEWTRGIERDEHQKLIDNFNKLGVIVPMDGYQLETERDENLPEELS